MPLALRSAPLAIGLAITAWPDAAPAQPPEVPEPAPPAPPAPTPASPASPGPAPTAPEAEAPASRAAPGALIDVTGRVVDSRGVPLAGASVSTEDHARTARTDHAGVFHLPGVAPGASLVVDAPHHSPALITATGPAQGDVALVDEATGEVIDIQGQAPADAPGAARLDRTELARIPGTGGDLVRTLTIMPGVLNTQLPTGPSGVVIRGSAPADSKILIDGFEIPILYHSIGFRAIVPTESIASLDYLPGGFDVAFGHAASGVVALTTRGGADARTEQAEVSVIDGGAIAQGRIDRDTHYMLGARRSTIDLILPHVLPSSLDLSLTTVPRYYDEQFRIDHAFSPHWTGSLSSIGSDDVLELFRDQAENPDKRFYLRTRFLRLTADARWHDGPWSAALATSGMLSQVDIEIGAVQFTRATPTTETTRAELTRTERELAGLTDVAFRIGAEAAIGDTSIDLAGPEQRREGQPRQMRDPNDVSHQFHGSVWTPDFAQWAAASASYDRVHATAGVRLDEFTRGGALAIQPRGELSVKLTQTTKLRLSAGEYDRPPEDREELLHAELQPERATQLIAGVEYQPTEALRIQASVYDTLRDHLITRDAMDTLGNWGTGTSYGSELLATLRSDPWFLWLSASLSHSTRVDYPGAEERLLDYDQPISINAAASWKSGRWTLGARFELYSGLPTTPVTGSVFNSDTNLYAPMFGAVNSQRAPIHHQLDLRVDRDWWWGPVKMTWFIDIQNVYLNRSVAGYSYSYDYSERLDFTSLPIIPSIGLKGQL
jgi:outer membrane receptor protein involved in Fe transport